MNEIKFRAWLWNEKEMSEVLVLDNQEEKVFVVRKDGASGWRMFAEVELVQYTGLKDKNGVEIYAGDILSYFGFEYEVIFEESAFGWYEDGQFYAFAEMAIDEIAKTKIIGNIYENTELLKGINMKTNDFKNLLCMYGLEVVEEKGIVFVLKQGITAATVSPTHVACYGTQFQAMMGYCVPERKEIVAIIKEYAETEVEDRKDEKLVRLRLDVPLVTFPGICIRTSIRVLPESRA